MIIKIVLGSVNKRQRATINVDKGFGPSKCFQQIGLVWLTLVCIVSFKSCDLFWCCTRQVQPKILVCQRFTDGCNNLQQVVNRWIIRRRQDVTIFQGAAHRHAIGRRAADRHNWRNDVAHNQVKGLFSQHHLLEIKPIT